MQKYSVSTLRGKCCMSVLQGCFSLQKCNTRFAGLERRERASMAFRPVSQDTSDWGKVEVLGTGYGLLFPFVHGCITDTWHVGFRF